MLFIATAVLLILQVTLPLRWASAPLLVAVINITGEEVVTIGPVSLSAVRLIIIAGLVRGISTGRVSRTPVCALDKCMFVWAMCYVISCLFQSDGWDQIVYRLGIGMNCLGSYMVFRVFLHNRADIFNAIKVLMVSVIPLAIEMLQEQVSGFNYYSLFGGVDPDVTIRNGRLRAQGPFLHSILAGSMGAALVPLFIGVYRYQKLLASLGITCCFTIILTSASSGPIISALAATFGFSCWYLRGYLSQLRYAALICYILLDIVMKAPAYFLISRIDLTGSSTGWHRAELIRMFFAHIDEWWLCGTNYTRHWMASGVPFSDNHVDLTNHYVVQGVAGGILLFLLFILCGVIGFRFVGCAMKRVARLSQAHEFFVFSCGVALFTHAITMLSISYFDNSLLVYHLVLALCCAHLQLATRMPNAQTGKIACSA